MVDVNQTRLFNRKVSEANLAQIQDVASEIKGFVGSILNYGSINITTAGPDGHVFEMDFVRWPNLVASTIIELRDNYTRNHTKEIATPVSPSSH
jgi:HD-GYP domain-containing protein (c-di-GMP phosphodiesterase class II)